MRFAFLALLTVGAIAGLMIRGITSAHEDVFTSYRLDPVRHQQEALREELSRLNIDRAYLLEPGRLAEAAEARGLSAPEPHEVIQVHMELPATPRGEGR